MSKSIPEWDCTVLEGLRYSAGPMCISEGEEGGEDGAKLPHCALVNPIS